MPYLLAAMIAASPSSYDANYMQAPSIVQTVKGYDDVPTWITHYSCSKEEGTADCITASGLPAKPGMVAHRTLPFGTVVWIDGKRYVVMDRGGGLGPNHFDVLVSTRKEAFRLGAGMKTVRIER